MRIDAWLLVAAIAFWGWQTGQWVVAGIAGVTLGASFVLPLRWDTSYRTRTRVADVCIVVAVLGGIGLLAREGNPQGLVHFFEWLPVAALPLALVHAYGTQAGLEQSVIFWRLRRKGAPPSGVFDPWFPYFAMWIVAASAANREGPGFFAGLVVLAAWPLLRGRPRAGGAWRFGLAFVAAAVLGYGLARQLHATQLWLEEAVPQWIAGQDSTDAELSETRLGHLGELKASDRIVLRVVPAAGATPARLLHVASYDGYVDRAWVARAAPFAGVPGGQGRWALGAGKGPATRTIVHMLDAGDAPRLALPPGTVGVERLDATRVQRNRLGAVQAARDAGVLTYVVTSAGEGIDEGPPTARDLVLPRPERTVFAKLADALGLRTAPATGRVAIVRRYFLENYEYSLVRDGEAVPGSPVVEFVTRSRKGHCEYFATATVLLLRAAGVPARYATGFAVVERSDVGDAYIARERHRHAWARAWVDGAWIDVDTTPPSWPELEAADRGWWTHVQDLWSWVHLRAAQALGATGGRVWKVALAALGGLALAWFAWRLLRARVVARRVDAIAQGTPERRGTDSEFFRIEAHLRGRGHARKPLEVTPDWLARLAAARVDTDGLAEIVALHYRHRFDPEGLAAEERARLRAQVEAWLARQAA
jgi:transglutaminase-like putative cysteine protease